VGMLKRMKDMKDMVEAAPGMVEQARQLGAQAQQYAAAQQAAAQMQMGQMMGAPQPAGAAAGPDFEPIAGVSIELYAEISKGLAAVGYDASRAAEIAATKGVSAESWAQAMAGWNQRVTANPAVAQRFNALYRAV
jgi:hypothetical protein